MSPLRFLPLFLLGCSTLQSVQDNPSVQSAETTGITIGLVLATKSPEFSFVAPIAVSGLTALADGKNPFAVTGANLTADSAQITQAVTAAIPNSAGKLAATQIVNAYVSGMQTMPKTATSANQVIAAIASGLNQGAVAVQTESARYLLSMPYPLNLLTAEDFRYENPFPSR